ncbi:SDR family NAD(P)-dependent oxidoreductase [Pedobacter sp. HMF7056]|uniref:SDR family NAD(P)-dependent oxidoreductase n=1 Tax=Hufsiella ginkgonis TaxID=2695274 RepID=A0A7K1XU56_9SPHI|nr:SDR family NAD(P)-dependent oxidoreductase [Hufsiella ginkgonis]
MNTKKVWFVTGASKGLGLVLVKKLLERGYRVAATSRNAAGLVQGAGEASSNFLPLQADLLNEQSVAGAIAATIAAFGTIDVVVNNAGYGQLGTLEELSDGEARKNFDVNVFGSLNVIRQVMPYLREKKSGAVFNISSIGGFAGNFPGWGIYCATKFAVIGFTEALAAEAKEFGITATAVYPGYFRTNFLSQGSLSLPEHTIKAYTAARETELIHEQQVRGNQPGDPEKAAGVLMAVAESDTPPLHLFLGQDAYAMARLKIATIERELNANEALATATAF